MGFPSFLIHIYTKHDFGENENSLLANDPAHLGKDGEGKPMNIDQGLRSSTQGAGARLQAASAPEVSLVTRLLGAIQMPATAQMGPSFWLISTNEIS